MGVLSHVGVPAAIGLMIGVLVRSIIKTVIILTLVAVVATALFSKSGASVSEEQVEQASSIIPTLAELSRGAFSSLKSSPAAVVGLALGVVLREKWRHRKSG